MVSFFCDGKSLIAFNIKSATKSVLAKLYQGEQAICWLSYRKINILNTFWAPSAIF